MDRSATPPSFSTSEVKATQQPLTTAVSTAQPCTIHPTLTWSKLVVRHDVQQRYELVFNAPALHLSLVHEIITVDAPTGLRSNLCLTLPLVFKIHALLSSSDPGGSCFVLTWQK